MASLAAERGRWGVKEADERLEQGRGDRSGRKSKREVFWPKGQGRLPVGMLESALGIMQSLLLLPICVGQLSWIP